MKHKISTLGLISGVAIIICSIVRWFFMYYDPSQMILGVGIGVIVCGFAYIYDWMKTQEEDKDKINKRLDAFTDWWTRQEMTNDRMDI